MQSLPQSKSPEQDSNKSIQSPSVLFENLDYLYLDKPCGWLSIPGRSSQGALSHTPVVTQWLSERYEASKFWVVHRLDRETSGVMVFAKNAESHRLACQAMEQRTSKKKYWVLVQGQSSFPPQYKCSVPVKGKASITFFKRILALNAITSILEADIRTGRTHQIRLHCQSLGFPVMGDALYGGVPGVRLGLHAQSLCLPGQPEVIAPLPTELKEWVDSIRSENLAESKS